MKKLITLFAVAAVFTACKQPAEQNTIEEIQTETEAVEVSKTYPEAISAIFEAHGGIDAWNAKNSLVFKFEGRSGVEKHKVSLKDRRSVIETNNWSIGNDGAQVWLHVTEGEYGGNARFYHNLFFYFYAMPFVVADDGITYSDVEATELPDGTYPGVKVSYGAGIGDSPDDEYIIFYDDTTKEMKWLAYTVTYGKGEKNENWSYIKYSEWGKARGLLMPKTLAWYNVEDGKPTTERNAMNIETLVMSDDEMSDSTFAMPEGATVVE